MEDFNAEIIADSLNKHGNRLTTFMVTFPRMILAEFNTHRMLSRNSASSRAIPFEKMLKRVEESPFIPIEWMKDHSGMQGNQYFNESYQDYHRLEELWLEARDEAVTKAKGLSSHGLTKQIVNRLLEPFMWHTVICTASEWENFFALRVHEAAEIHMQKIASMMLDVYNASEPKQLKAGEWHIPFGDKMDEVRLSPFQTHVIGEQTESLPSIEMLKVMVATARCARLSYLNYEGKDDYEADIKLHNMLCKMGHWSPFEHCAKAMHDLDLMNQYSVHHNNEVGDGWCGNFRGFIQYRKTFENENRTDERVIKKV